MTDHSRYKSPSGAQLTLRRRTSDSLDLDQRLFLMVDGRGMFIPTAELLAMIDAADPDAMRAYLRETVEQTYLENMSVPTIKPEIPEADSPEDVDEHPEPVVTVAPESLDAAEQLGRYVAEIRDAFARGIAR